MPKEIWNEGRIVGESSYEIYVKQHFINDPDTPVATEREWLAASIASGSSLLLKLGDCGQESTHTMVDIRLPRYCTLTSANTIVASFFDGDAMYEDAPYEECALTACKWATKITDYGMLIANDSTDSPSATADPITQSNIPGQTLSNYSATQLSQLKEYMKIVDGLILQPGKWVENDTTPPQKDFHPNLSSDVNSPDPSTPTLRLHIYGEISNNPQILLTGFTIRSVLSGICNTNGSTDTDKPYNGDFLGPDTFPWASKVIFSVPTSYIQYFSQYQYDRKLKSPTFNGGTYKTEEMNDAAIIDMRATDPATFYVGYNSTYHSMYTDSLDSPRISYQVASKPLGSSDGNAVLTVYQKKDIYPPALYGTFAKADGTLHLDPLDVVAPGSVKMFYDLNLELSDLSHSVLHDYETTFPGTHAFNLTSSGKIQYQFGSTVRTLVDSASSGTLSIQGLYNDGDASTGTFKTPAGDLSGDDRPKLLRTMLADGTSAFALMMSTNVVSSDSTTLPNRITISKNPAVSPGNASVVLTHSNSNDEIAWSSLLYGLAKNCSIDVLGDGLKINKYTISKPLSETGPSWSTIDDPYDTTTGTAHAVFGDATTSNNLHLYVSKDLPKAYSSNTNIPVNSIGSGWLMPKDSWHKNATGASSSDTGSDKSWPYTYKLTKLKTSLPSDPNISDMLSTMEIGDYFWKPMFGAEYSSGHVESSYGEASGGVVSNPNYSHIVQYWESCLIIFGRTISGTCNPTIAYVDRWGSIYYINNDSNFVITVETYAETPSTNRTYKIRLQNKFLRADGDVLVTSEADYWICGTPFRNSTVLSNNT